LRRTLDFYRALHGFNDAVEFDQHAVADELYDSAAMPFHGGRNQFGSVRLKGGKRAGFIGAHEPTIAGDVGGKDRGQSTSHSALRAICGQHYIRKITIGIGKTGSATRSISLSCRIGARLSTAAEAEAEAAAAAREAALLCVA
jgi:hypothetical protein